MTVVVSFITPGSGGKDVSGVASCRVRENLALNGTTVATVQAGEMIIIGNAETSMVAVAWGTTPDAAAVADNSPVTSAGFPIGAGQISAPLRPPTGSKINVKVVT